MAGRPDASCLVVSPKDMGIERRKQVITRPAIPRIVRGAKNAAQLAGCAYFNLFEALGGSGTMNRWYKMKPPLVSHDYGHLHDRGALKTGEVLAEMMNKEYENYLRRTKGKRR